MIGSLISAAIFLVPVAVWLLFRSRGYKRALLAAPPGAGWRRSGERFIDPTTNEPAEVWWKETTGERAYVKDGLGPFSS